MRRAIPFERLHLLRKPSDSGLRAEDVSLLRSQFGPNDIVEVPAHAWRAVITDTLKDPMLWFLVGTGVLYAFLGEFAESLTLLASVVPLVGMDAVLHRRTQASTQGLRSRLAAQATALRDGQFIEIPSQDLVPGDLVRVITGQPFPADGVLVAGHELQSDESALTGEAHPVRKHALAAPESIPSGQQHALGVDVEHWGFAGTRLLTSEAILRVVFTGQETFYGEIVHSARAGAHARTPLQVSVGNLVRVLLIAAGVLCVILATVRLQQGFGWIDALLSAVTLAVAALPEEFPVVFVMFLGVGVYRLARQKALVRRSVSVENIGRVTCICSDKTGTITLGELRLAHRVTAGGGSDSRLLALAAMASREETGDPLDVAILTTAAEEKAGLTMSALLATFPFTEDRRRETVLADIEGEGRVTVTKGAPEVVLAMCALSEDETSQWTARVSQLAQDGHKVIGCASRALSEEAWAGGEPDRGFRFAGLLALEDPVREGVADAVAQCRESGIHIVMVTGDHPSTATAVAREIGLGGEEPAVVTGEALEALLRKAGTVELAALDVVARAMPAQKLALVRAFQSQGEIVAVTGDGVNDVPALQVADIGVAMGERATRSAREVASVVLLDDNFRTIVRAIAEGRQLFRNLRRSFSYLLMVHMPLVITAALIPLAGYPLLYLPIHIVWLELVIHPSALLAFQDRPNRARLEPVRRHNGTTFFSQRQWAMIFLVGLLLTGFISFGYGWSLGAGRNVAHARAMALVVLTVGSANLTSVLSGLRTPAARWISAGTLALTLLLVQVPPIAQRLHVAPLHRDDWAIAIGTALLACLPVLFEFRRRRVSTARP